MIEKSQSMLRLWFLYHMRRMKSRKKNWLVVKVLRKKTAAKASTSKTVAQPSIWDSLQVAVVYGIKPRSNPPSNF